MQNQQWKDEHHWFEWPYKKGKIIRHYIGWDFRMWPLALLTGFSYKKKYGYFTGPRKKVGIITSWPYCNNGGDRKAGCHCKSVGVAHNSSVVISLHTGILVSITKSNLRNQAEKEDGENMQWQSLFKGQLACNRARRNSRLARDSCMLSASRACRLKMLKRSARCCKTSSNFQLITWHS